MEKIAIHTEQAPKAIGTYSQAIQAHGFVYLSAQAPLHPQTMTVVEGGIENEIRQVFDNLEAVAQGAGGSLNSFVKLTVYLTDLANFPLVNQVMEQRFSAPFPARAVIGVVALPRATQVAIEGIMALPHGN